MSRAITPQTREICERYSRALELNTPAGVIVGELAAKFDVQRPAIWKALRSGGVLPPYAPVQRGGNGRPSGGGVSGYSEARRTASLQSSSRESMDLLRELSDVARDTRKPGQTLQDRLNELRRDLAA